MELISKPVIYDGLFFYIYGPAIAITIIGF